MNTILLSIIATAMLAATPQHNMDDFAFGLYHEINGADPQQDLFISPFSAGTALALLNSGAAGTTADEICGMLGFEGTGPKVISTHFRDVTDAIGAADPATIFESANSVWVGKNISLKCAYRKNAGKFFDAQVSRTDFGDPSSVEAINRWCSEKTHGKIREILDSTDPGIRLMLVNALYFNAAWEFGDFPSVKDEQFTCIDGTKTDNAMMYKTRRFGYSEDDNFSMLEIPYGNGSFALYVLLPKDTTATGFSEASGRLDAAEWENLSSGIRSRQVSLVLPKFKMEYEVELNDALNALGMKEAFGTGARFPGISRVPLMVSYVKQKTYLDINEKGTEAAAVTSIGLRATSVAPVEIPLEFRADRPFIFIIRERTSGEILFIGQKVR